MDIKEAIKGYKLLDSLAKEIAYYAVKIEVIPSRFERRVFILGITNTLDIKVDTFYSDDYTKLYIPIEHIINNTWKEYLCNTIKIKK